METAAESVLTYAQAYYEIKQQMEKTIRDCEGYVVAPKLYQFIH